MECPREKLSAYLDGEVPWHERGALEDHIAHCADCARELDALRNLSGAIEEAFEPDRQVVGRIVRGTQRGRRRGRRLVAGLAAAAALALAIHVALFLLANRPVSPIVSLKGGTLVGQTVATARGETADLRLLDGVAIALRETSRLDVPRVKKGEPARSVFLYCGSIRVSVPPASERGAAFSVATPVGSVQTLGTVFEVALVHPDGKGGYVMSEAGVKSVVGMLLLVTVFSGQVLVRHASGEEEVVKPLPEGLTGFQGQLIGSLVSKTDDSFVLKVEQILRTWQGNKAENPAASVGKEVAFVIRKDDGRGAKFVETLKGLAVGDRIETEGFHYGGNVLTVVEVLKKASALPAGIQGFRGIVTGAVVKKGKNGVVLKVEKIGQTWKENKAQDPACIVGKEVALELYAKSRMAEEHRKVLGTLAVGDRVEAEVFHLEADCLSIVETFRKVE